MAQKKSHKSKRIRYIKGDTSKINKHLTKFKKKINAVFHFLENLQEYTKVLKILTNVFNQIQLVQKKFSNLT